MARLRVYLAGPDVFLPDRAAIFAAKGALCDRYGFEPAPPMDAGKAEPSGSLSHRIYCRNIELMDGADLIVANLTPFRGPSADVGTVFELGYGLARGLPVFGYSNDPRPFFDRVEAFAGAATKGSDGRPYAPDGLAVEDFGLVDNLMIDHALEATGGVLSPDGEKALDFTDLTVFERCLARAATSLAASGRDTPGATA